MTISLSGRLSQTQQHWNRDIEEHGGKVANSVLGVTCLIVAPTDRERGGSSKIAEVVKIRPKLTLSVFLKVMLLGLLERVIDQNLYYMGMKSTSAIFAAATVNVLHALTFIMAIILRMERVNLRQKHGLSKVIGTSITLSGAMLMTLYKGPAVNILGGYSHDSEHENSGDTSSGQHWVAGTIMLLSCIVGWSAFFIVQSMTLKEYPAALSLTSLICVMGMLEGGVVALVMERDMSAWAIGFDSRLLAAAYSVDQTACGQMIDLITTLVGEKDLSKYSLPIHRRIVQYKTAYYSFYLPVACALIMAGEDIEKHTNVKDILIEMGTYFQVQDDYLDCFGAPKVIGKIGTDIEDFKCSWLVVKALELSNEEQKKFLYENYGKEDPSSVAKVKELYKTLKLEDAFAEYESKSYEKLINLIEAHPNTSVQAVLKSFLGKPTCKYFL